MTLYAFIDCTPCNVVFLQTGDGEPQWAVAPLPTAATVTFPGRSRVAPRSQDRASETAEPGADEEACGCYFCYTFLTHLYNFKHCCGSCSDFVNSNTANTTATAAELHPFNSLFPA